VETVNGWGGALPGEEQRAWLVGLSATTSMSVSSHMPIYNEESHSSIAN
jgi:hypothetical protein